MTPIVVEEPERERFTLRLDGAQVGAAEYRDVDGVRVLHHTETAPEHGGKGFASILVRAVLDEARANDRKVVPSCSYVHRWIELHPDYGDLVAGRVD